MAIFLLKQLEFLRWITRDVGSRSPGLQIGFHLEFQTEFQTHTRLQVTWTRVLPHEFFFGSPSLKWILHPTSAFGCIGDCKVVHSS
jgi:hypothetical protein